MMGQNDPHNEEGTNDGEEGPISPDDLESRNTDRSKTVINMFGDVTIKRDGGVNELVRDKGEQVESLVIKLIILAVLIFLVVAVWRLGSIISLVELIAS